MRPTPPAGYSLRGLDPDDLPALCAIEDRATALLASHGHPALLDEPATTVLEMERSLAGKGVWVAVQTASDTPVGYAVASDLGDIFWLHQMSVDPAHGRKGIGRALLAAVIGHARWAFHSAVGLSTFIDVPFNAPFYEKAGFVRVSDQALPDAIRAQSESEVPCGIAQSPRSVMIRRL